MFEKDIAKRPKDTSLCRKHTYKILDKIYHPFWVKDDLMIAVNCYLDIRNGYMLTCDMTYQFINEWLKKNNKEIKRR